MAEGGMKWVHELGSETSPEKFLRHFGRTAGHRRLETLVREVAQNTIDARADQNTPAVLTFLDRTMEGQLWSQLAAPDITISDADEATATDAAATDIVGRQEAASEAVRGDAGREGVRVLVVSDRNTRGLGGPVGNFGSREVAQDYRRITSIGAASGKTGGAGGSYGLGRSLLFLLSGCRTILIDSVHEEEGRKVRRIIGMRLLTTGEIERFDGKQGEDDGYTSGVAWWRPGPTGERHDSGHGPHPLTGEAGDLTGPVADLARTMGLHREAGEGATGTDIYLIGFTPDGTSVGSGPDDGPTAIEVIEAAAAVNLWPAMTSPEEERAALLEVHVSEDHATENFGSARRAARKVDLTDSRFWPLRPWVDAYTSSDGAAYGHSKAGLPTLRKSPAAAGLSKVEPTERWLSAESDQPPVSSIALFRDSTRIVLGYFDQEPGFMSGGGGARWKFIAGSSTSIWRAGFVHITGPDAGLLRNIENEKHTRWNRSGARREELMALDRAGETMRELAAKMDARQVRPTTPTVTGIISSIAEQLSGTLFGQAPGKNSGRARREPGGGGGGGGGAGVPAPEVTFSEVEGRLRRTFTFPGLAAGTYLVAAHEDSVIGRKADLPKVPVKHSAPARLFPDGTLVTGGGDVSLHVDGHEERAVRVEMTAVPAGQGEQGPEGAEGVVWAV